MNWILRVMNMNAKHCVLIEFCFFFYLHRDLYPIGQSSRKVCVHKAPFNCQQCDFTIEFHFLKNETTKNQSFHINIFLCTSTKSQVIELAIVKKSMWNSSESELCKF